MKFSIIIPVYNKAETICDSIESVLRQSYKDYELIIVNDGSTDNINKVIKRYEGEVKVINQINSGVSIARNVGINNAYGEYVCFLDADDIWLENHLETLVKMINIYKEDVFFATMHITKTINDKQVHQSEKFKKFPPVFKCKNLFKMLNTYGDEIILTNNVCIKRDILIRNNLLFEPHIKIGEDTDLWYRIALKFPVVISKNETTIYRREFSTATKKTNNDYNWIFSTRKDDIIKDVSINAEIKRECLLLMDRYHLACVRDYIFDGNKIEAKKRIKLVRNKKGKRYIITFIFTLLPLVISKKIYSYIYRK